MINCFNHSQRSDLVKIEQETNRCSALRFSPESYEKNANWQVFWLAQPFTAFP